MNDNKKTALQVSALCNGTVIDHIPADKLFAVVNLLNIPAMGNNVTIGYNLESKKLGKKGLIKISDRFFTDDEINKFHLSTLKLSYEEAIREYEKSESYSLGRLIANREIPILKRAKEIIDKTKTKNEAETNIL